MVRGQPIVVERVGLFGREVQYDPSDLEEGITRFQDTISLVVTRRANSMVMIGIGEEGSVLAVTDSEGTGVAPCVMDGVSMVVRPLDRLGPPPVVRFPERVELVGDSDQFDELGRRAPDS